MQISAINENVVFLPQKFGIIMSGTRIRVSAFGACLQADINIKLRQ